MVRHLNEGIYRRLLATWRMSSKQNVITHALGRRAYPHSEQDTYVLVRQQKEKTVICYVGAEIGCTKSANTIRAEWLRFTNTPVSRMLMNLRLIRAGYFARRHLKKLLLLQRHRQARMDWARNHLRWRPGHWQHVIFSDESRFVLYRIDGRIRLRRQQDEAYNEECSVPRGQAGGGGVTIWGVFH